MTSRPITLAIAAALATPATAQIFDKANTNIPQGLIQSRYTEQVDFGDVDLDGDFDAALSRGGDLGNLQDSLWINQGGLQGGTVGVFTDDTAARFPVQARTGRDIEFVDFDADGDLDLYSVNVSQLSNQACHWWTNLGGAQAGSLGYYVDETATRWVNLAGPGSSIPALALVDDGFITWGTDGDFADLDNDGDLDLVHATYGGSFGGQNPSRIFLNDSLGHFEEFNPSGYQLVGVNLSDGDPGIWCEGTQQNDTTDTTGTFCDVTNNGVDIELGDIDGDFDIDLLHGGRDFLPRFFDNRLEENGGSLGFRDVTVAVFPPDYADTSGNYDQELGDFDGDNDLDLFGVDWASGGFDFGDVTLENLGGTFGPPVDVPDSSSDAEEADWGDFDNDGDLDVYVATFSGENRLYENDGTGALTTVPANVSGLDEPSVITYDGEWSDVDNDGTWDIFSANGLNETHNLYLNATGVPDTTAPRVAPVEAIGNQTAGLAGSPDLPVRTHVYDNVAYYLNWYNDVDLLIEVDGVLIDELDARSSGGQVFRGELPSNLVGDVEYRFRATDRQGNVGLSSPVAYTSTIAPASDLEYGTGTAGTTGSVHVLDAHSAGTPGKPLYLSVRTNGTPTVFVLAVSLGSIAPTPVPDLGIVNIDPTAVVKSILGVTDATGVRVYRFAPDATLASAVPFSTYWQVFGFDGAGSDTYSSSRGLEVKFQ